VLNKILDEIDDLLLPYMVDLSIYGNLRDRDLLDHIRQVGIPFYKKEEAVSEKPQ